MNKSSSKSGGTGLGAAGWRPVTGLVVLMAGRWLAEAADVPVPNGSFESPVVGPPLPVDTRIDGWQKTPAPVWFDPVAMGGITWDQLSGVFPNTPASDPRYIDNLDGSQAVYLFPVPTAGFFQDYESMDWNDAVPSHAFDATFQVGLAYELTVGVIGGGGGMPEGTALQLGLYYRDDSNLPVTVAVNNLAYTAAGFPSTTHFVDQMVNLPEVQAGDAWAGRKIGVQIVALSGAGAGYWDLDNVRLTAVAVPEPGAGSLLLVGLAGWLCVSRRSRRGL